MKTLLIYPPVWRILSAPYFSLPPLAAFLKEKGIETKIFDLNIEAVNETSKKEFLDKYLEILQHEFESVDKKVLFEKEQWLYLGLSNLITKLDPVKELTDEAKRVLKDPVDFYNYEKYGVAYTVFSTFLDCISIAESFTFDVKNENHDKNSITKFIKDLETYDGKLSMVYSFLETRIQELIKIEKPEIIGISVTAPQQTIYGFLIAKLVKEFSPETIVVLGGAEITYEKELILNKPELFRYVDYFIVFEGETALISLINELKGGREFEKVPNLLYLNDDIPKLNRHISENYRDLPTPDYSDIVWHNYFAPKPVIYLTTSRGCYFGKCTFCADIYGYPKYKVRTPQKVFDDMKKLSEQNNTNLFFFNDECLPPGLMKKLAHSIIEEQLDFRWTGEMRFEKVMDRNFIKLMAEGGCKRIMFGLETASPRLMELMKKEIDINHAEKLLNYCYEEGISTEIFMIDNYPTETKAEKKLSYDFVERIPKLFGFAVAFTPFRLFRLSLMGEEPQKYDLEIIEEERESFRQPLVCLNADSNESSSSMDSIILNFNLNSMYKINYPPLGVENLLYISRREKPEPLERVTVVQANKDNTEDYKNYTLSLSKYIGRVSTRHNFNNIKLNLEINKKLKGKVKKTGGKSISGINTTPSFPSKDKSFELIYSLENNNTFTFSKDIGELLNLIESNNIKIKDLMNMKTDNNQKLLQTVIDLSKEAIVTSKEGIRLS